MSRDKNILVDVWLLSLLTQRLASERLDGLDLSVDEFAIYGLIVDLAPVSAADLVKATGMSPTTVSGIIRRCQKRGELERITDPADRRRSHLALTDRGGEVYLNAVPTLLGLLDDLGNHLVDADTIRVAIQDLDDGIRRLLGVGERPYRVEPSGESGPKLDYGGIALTRTQEKEVRRFIDWVRARDADGGGS